MKHNYSDNRHNQYRNVTD